MRCRTLLLLLGIISFFSHAGYAQTPGLAARYFEAGEKKRQHDDWPGAVEDYTRAIKVNAHFDSTRSRPAESNEVAVADSFTAYAYTNRGVARFYLGDLDAALADFDRALRIKPKLSEAYSGRAAVLLAKGDYDGALLDFERALSINDKLVEVYNNRGYLLIEKRELAKALKDFERAIELKPTLSSAYQGRGIVFMKQARFDLAVKDFTRTLALDPANGDVYGNRGLAFMMLNRDVEASTDLQKCVELNPELKTNLEQRIAIARKLKSVSGGKLP